MRQQRKKWAYSYSGALRTGSVNFLQTVQKLSSGPVTMVSPPTRGVISCDAHM